MKDLLFIKDSKGCYITEFISSGRTVIHINRITTDELKILAAIDNLPPVTLYKFGNDSATNLIFELCLIPGLRITLKSYSEVLEAKMIEV